MKRKNFLYCLAIATAFFGAGALSRTVNAQENQESEEEFLEEIRLTPAVFDDETQISLADEDSPTDSDHLVLDVSLNQEESTTPPTEADKEETAAVFTSTNAADSETQKGTFIADGTNTDVNHLQTDYVFIQASSGTDNTNNQLSSLVQSVLEQNKVLGLYHEAQNSSSVESEANNFYEATKDYRGQFIPLLSYKNLTESTGPVWVKDFLNIYYSLSAVKPIVSIPYAYMDKADWSDVQKDYEIWNDPTSYAGTLDELKKKTAMVQSDGIDLAYRLYNPNSGEHFYTLDVDEKTTLTGYGWRYEGIDFYSPRAGLNVYRLYNPNAGDHHYTLDYSEVQNLVNVGWNYESIGWLAEKEAKKPVYRCYNPNAIAGAHHFTTDKEEYDYLTSIGWRKEGIGWYSAIDFSFSSAKPKENYLKNELAYNTNRVKIYSVQKIGNDYYYFDPNNQGKYARGSGLKKIEDGTSIYVNADGKLAVGQLKLENYYYWFKPETARMAISTFIDIPAAYNNGQKKTCYYDDNGHMVFGTVTINGMQYDFDNQTGALLKDYRALQELVVNYINQNKNRSDVFSVGFIALNTGGSFLWNNHTQQSASSIKLFVAAMAYDNYSTLCAKYGKSTIDYNLRAMITVSSNDAWSNLVTWMGNGSYYRGTQKLSQWCSSKGYTQTYSTGISAQNYTSARDTANIVADFYNNKLAGSNEILNLMKQQQRKWKLPTGIPAGITTGNKTGELWDTENDTMIVFAPGRPFVLSVLTEKLANNTYAWKMMGQISKIVYNFITK